MRNEHRKKKRRKGKGSNGIERKKEKNTGKKSKSINKNPTFVETGTLRMRWSRFTPVARPSLGWEGPGYRCAERFDGQKRGCEGNIFTFNGWFRFEMWGIWGCGVGFRTTLRGTTYTDWCVQQVPLGPDRLKKKVWGVKVSSSGVLYFCFFFRAPRGMSCNASPVHDGFLFSPGPPLLFQLWVLSMVYFFIWNQHINGRRRFSCMMPVEVYADRNCFFSWRIQRFYASRNLKAKSPRGKVGHLH